VFSIRSLRHMVWQTNPFNNLYLVAAVLFGWVMLVAAVHWAPLQSLLRTVPLTYTHWLIMVIFGILNLLILECMKGFFILNHKKNSANHTAEANTI